MIEDCIGELSIYNVKGEKTITLFTNETIAKDELFRITWNGKDNSDKAVSAGIYFYQLNTNKRNYARKMILLK